jgi:molybdopterin synthase catalytic subunit
MIAITNEPISPEILVNQVKTDGSGCLVTYIGLIRDQSRGKPVLSVEYSDAYGTAEERLKEIVSEARAKWQLNGMAMHHRIGTLKVGDINLVVAVASAHREEGFAACQYAIDQFKQKLPTQKRETYQDGTVFEGE